LQNGSNEDDSKDLIPIRDKPAFVSAMYIRIIICPCATSGLSHLGTAPKPTKNQKQKIDQNCNFFAIRDCSGAPNHELRAKNAAKTAAQRLISALQEQEGVRNRKKVAKTLGFLFLERIDRRNEANPQNRRGKPLKKLAPQWRTSNATLSLILNAMPLT